MSFQSGGVSVGRGYFGMDTEGWNLLATTSDGLRDFTYEITFPKEFGEAPTVFVGLRGFHVQKGEDVRLAIGVSNILTTGFTLHVNSWADTSVVGVGVNWMAYDSDSAL